MSIRRRYIDVGLVLMGVLLLIACQRDTATNDPMQTLLSKMTLEEKVGQLSMRNADDRLGEWIKDGKVGAILNEVDPDKLAEYQRIAREETRLGIPLLTARDVIHGFRTIFPVPLGQAASWNPELVEQGAAIAAVEATSQGINWTFAPMMDVTRDPRWGRVVESFGEDAYLSSVLSAAMVKGFQGEDLTDPRTIAACAKHFLAYGWAEGGRDYNTANLGQPTLHDHILPPFHAAIGAGAATVMTAFQDLNGIPATGHPYWVGEYLRDHLAFDGVVVSDWESIPQMITHGYVQDDKAAAKSAITATVDMEMQSRTFEENLRDLIDSGVIEEALIDAAVLRILRLKDALGLFEPTAPIDYPELVAEEHVAAAQAMATESFVLLKNENKLLPLTTAKKVAVIGPLAHAPHEQLGTWIFDGKAEDAITPWESIKNAWPEGGASFAEGLRISRTLSTEGFDEALQAANASDVVLVFLGEESIITGESHSRADIRLPGAQEALVKALSQTGKPIVAIVLAGRPLTMEHWLEDVDAILYAFHPGTMTGPAVVDLLTGKANPSGKLPMTFPKHVGQVPIYYNHTNTGKPATPQSYVNIQDIPEKAVQTSVGNTSHYLDYGYEPQFPFGYGLSYTDFTFSDLQLSHTEVAKDDTLTATVQVTNTGDYGGHVVVQLYVRDHVASRVQPVRSLKGFTKVYLAKGESQQVSLALPIERLAFYTARNTVEVEPGTFTLFIGEDANASLSQTFICK